jgi:hypothetical protein
MPKKRLFIVGNGPLPHDLSDRVDGSDHVVRFNEPKAAVGMSGTRTDWLFLNNTGKPMQRRLKNDAYWTSPIVAAAHTVFFVYHPTIIRAYAVKPNVLSRLKGRRADWTGEALARFGAIGKFVTVVPPPYYELASAEIGVSRDKLASVFPSTGYFGIRYALETFGANEWDVEICGFSWQGWKRHAWGDERSWVERKSCERAMRVWLHDENEAG